MNSEFISVRLGLARPGLANVTTDSPVALRVWNKAGNAVTSVTVTTGTGIVLIDSSGTTTITFATAGQTTLAGVAATLNATANWGARILDGLGTQASASTLLDGAITSVVRPNGVRVWDVKQDTSTALQFVYCASYSREVGTADTSLNLHRVVLNKMNYAVNMGTAAADGVRVWARKLNQADTQILSALSVDTTATTVFDYTAGGSSFSGITEGEGYEYVCQIVDAATLADAASNVLQVAFTRV